MHSSPAHMCQCTLSCCTFGHLVFSRRPQKSTFYSPSVPFGRGSDSSPTESKQPPFRGKYFAMCYFSAIYYEYIFPFIQGFANSLESQSLTVDKGWLQLSSHTPHGLPHSHFRGDPVRFLPAQALFQERRVFSRSLGSPPALLKARDT